MAARILVLSARRRVPFLAQTEVPLSTLGGLHVIPAAERDFGNVVQTTTRGRWESPGVSHCMSGHLAVSEHEVTAAFRLSRDRLDGHDDRSSVSFAESLARRATREPYPLADREVRWGLSRVHVALSLDLGVIASRQRACSLSLKAVILQTMMTQPGLWTTYWVSTSLPERLATMAKLAKESALKGATCGCWVGVVQGFTEMTELTVIQTTGGQDRMEGV